MVLTVSVELAAALPVTFAAGAEQVGVSVAPAGLVVTAQVKLTEPVKPPEGVTVRVLVPEEPGLAMVMFPLFESEKLAGTGVLTMRLSVVVSVLLPDVPVTVMV